ncbi:unnamed protein product [Prunus brigantina]
MQPSQTHFHIESQVYSAKFTQTLLNQTHSNSSLCNESSIHCESLNYEWLDSRKGYVGIMRLDLGTAAKPNTHVLFLYDGIKGFSLVARDCN